MDSLCISTESTALMPVIQNNPWEKLPTEIFDQIFGALDQTSVRQIRLVDRKWNQSALNILSKTPGKVNLYWNYFRKEFIKPTKGVDQIKYLHSILPFAERPEMFFTKLTLFNGELADIQLLNLLQKFGSTLKSLELTRFTLHLPILQQLLKNWCQNLEELTLDALSVTEDKNLTIKCLESSPTPLNLNIRKFKVYEDDGWNSFFDLDLTIFVIKNSANLQVLHLDTTNGERDLWKRLQNLPQITENLQEVKIKILGEGTTDFFNLIRDISFRKLTSLELKLTNLVFPRVQLLKLLSVVGESLKELYLHLNCVNKSNEDRMSNDKIQLPVLKNLKTLEYSFGYELLFNSIEFLKNMPKLEILRFSRYRMNRWCRNSPDFVDTLFSSSYLQKHTTLHTLVVQGSSRYIKTPIDPETIRVIGWMLPSLRDLTLAVDNRGINRLTRETWLNQILTRISEMKNLKTLHLIFYGSLVWDYTIHFKKCLSTLEALKSLEELTITRTWSNCQNLEPYPPGLEKVNIPNLKTVKLDGFYMANLEWIELSETLAQKGILLKKG